MLGNLAYPKKSKQQVFISKLVFDWKENASIEKEGEEERKVIINSLSVIYDFEEKKKAFLSSFCHALIIFSSSSPPRC